MTTSSRREVVVIARVILGEAAVRIGVDSSDAELEAERSGERYGKAFAHAAEVSVGALNVRVDPDTARLGERIRGALASNGAFTIDLSPSTRRMLTDIRATLAAASPFTIDVTAKVDTTRIREDIRAAAAGAGPLKVNVSGDLTKLRDEIRAASPTVNVGLNADTRTLVAQIRAALDAETFKVNVHADTTRLREEVKAALAGLDAKVKVSVDDSATSALRSLGNEADNAGKKLRKTGDDADSGVSGLQRLKTVASSVGDVFRGWLIGNLAPFIIPAIGAIGALTGALALIPAGVFAAGSALATLKIGTSGLSETFKAFGAASDAAGTSSAQAAATQLASANAIVSAQEQVRNATRSVADAQRANANAIISAQEAVHAAIQSVADAERQSTSSIISATESVANAKRAESNAITSASFANQQALQAEQRAEESNTAAVINATRAQQNLNDAKQSAARSIEDLQNRVKDDALAQRSAVTQLNAAQLALQQTQVSGTGSLVGASQAQRDAAQLAFDQAQQHLDEISLQYQRSQVDAAKAAAAGVDGSKQVVSAQDQVLTSQRALRDSQVSLADAQAKVTSTQLAGQQSVAASQQKVLDSQRALTDAQITGAERIAAAQQKVGDAQRALSTAQINGAEQIVKAQESVVSAQRGLQQAIAASAASAATGVGALSKYNAELAKLAPNAQGFVRSVVGLSPAFTDLKLDVQQRLFAGLGDQIKVMGAVDLPVVRVGLGLMASALNGLAIQATEFATSKQAVADYGVIFQNVADAVDRLKPAIKPILQIFTDLAVVGSGFLPDLAQHFSEAAQKAADFVHNARDTGKLKEFIQKGIDAVRELFLIVKDLIAIFKDLAGGPGDHGLLDILKDFTGAIRFLIEKVPGATTLIELFIVAWRLSPIVKGIREIASVLKLVLGPAVIEATAEAGALAGAKGLGGVEAAAAKAGGAAGLGKFAGALKIGGIAIGAYLVGEALLAVGRENVGDSFKDRAQSAADFAGKLLTLDFPGLFDAISQSTEGISSAAGKVGTEIETALTPLPASLTGITAGLNIVIDGGVKQIGATIGTLPALAQASLVQLAPAMRGPTEAALGPLLPVVTQGMQDITNIVQGLSPKVQEALKPLSPGMQQAVGSVLDGLLPTVSTGIQDITNLVGQLPPKASDSLAPLPRSIQDPMNVALGSVARATTDGINSIADQIGRLPSAARDNLGGLTDAVRSPMDTALGSVGPAVNAGIGNITDLFRRLPGGISGAVGDQRGLLVQAGHDIMAGLYNGIAERSFPVYKLVENIAESIKGITRQSFRISSPSQVFADIGDALGQGLIRGITRVTPAAVSASQDMATRVTAAVEASSAVATISVGFQTEPGVNAAVQEITAAFQPVTKFVTALFHPETIQVDFQVPTLAVPTPPAVTAPVVFHVPQVPLPTLPVVPAQVVFQVPPVLLPTPPLLTVPVDFRVPPIPTPTIPTVAVPVVFGSPPPVDFGLTVAPVTVPVSLLAPLGATDTAVAAATTGIPPVVVPITFQSAAVDAATDIAAAFTPITVPVVFDTSSVTATAAGTVSAFNPVTVPVRFLTDIGPALDAIGASFPPVTVPVTFDISHAATLAVDSAAQLLADITSSLGTVSVPVTFDTRDAITAAVAEIGTAFTSLTLPAGAPLAPVPVVSQQTSISAQGEDGILNKLDEILQELRDHRSIVTNVEVHNPTKEQASDSINRELRKFAALGGFSG